jgi:hypothetical protein
MYKKSVWFIVLADLASLGVEGKDMVIEGVTSWPVFYSFQSEEDKGSRFGLTGIIQSWKYM